jgi:hypothetical protein
MRRHLVLACALVLLAGGCFGPHVVTVAAGDGTAHVANGDILRVDLGSYNASIGDSWYLVGQPDPGVLVEKDQEFDADCGNPGCGGRLAWTFTATGPGDTTLAFRYCYRSGPDNCAAMPNRGPADPVRLIVEVS